MDWDKATDELRKKLDPFRVKCRQQGGGEVQYIEGWWAIAEMNEVFGFDAWTRETVDLRQLGEPREVNGKFRVDYMARVRVTVGDVVREGCGFGQGIDKDVGQAHESALKEAETDAMKRAMMTFGNRFGLALYDKSRENVGVDEPPFDHRARTDEILGWIDGCKTQQHLRDVWVKNGATLKRVEADKPPMFAELVAAKDRAKARLTDDPAHQAPPHEAADQHEYQ